MARSGDIIEAPARGERIRFLQTEAETDGTLLQFDWFTNPGAGFMPAHVHLNQRERYVVVSGTATYVLDGEERTAREGDVVDIKPGTFHVNPWNNSDDHLVLRVDAWPTLGVEKFFETWFGLVRDNRRRHLNRHLIMNYFQGALTVGHIASETYNETPPVALQRLAIPVLGALGRLICFKPWYPEYTKED